MRIGLEIHIQLPTKSKMFCSCPTTVTDVANTYVCPVCLGLPGSKPSLNVHAVELGLVIAKRLKCTIPDTTWFSRKSYFYPDLCKHFQITQYDVPIGKDGVFYLEKKLIRIRRCHLEEDPGRIKRTDSGLSLIDYNRSGVPLIEIVTEPDISSPAEAREFLSALLVEIRSVIDLNDDRRSIRCDCNISVGKERCEVKNVTGLKNVELCLRYEAVRQTKLIKAGGAIERETRRFDEVRKATFPARKKEFEADYGYIGEPDLGIYHLSKIVDGIHVREGPLVRIERFQKDYSMSELAARQIINTSMKLADLFEELVKISDVGVARSLITGVIAANWKTFEPVMSEKIEELKETVVEFFDGKITDVECNLKLKALMTGGKSTGMSPIESTNLDVLVERIIKENPTVLEDCRKNQKAGNRIIGMVMKQTNGQYSSSDIVATTKRMIERMCTSVKDL
ncbi:MAG: Asp-tRNA(Asn)/Glu-tRNA(Gln) amidotransferase subunit GatB [archaeon]|nr:Asp-tRNA(Asn)/Glu-tRNA(Gln) amidotransferase subunit GatB [archaeon]